MSLGRFLVVDKERWTFSFGTVLQVIVVVLYFVVRLSTYHFQLKLRRRPMCRHILELLPLTANSSEVGGWFFLLGKIKSHCRCPKLSMNSHPECFHGWIVNEGSWTHRLDDEPVFCLGFLVIQTYPLGQEKFYIIETFPVDASVSSWLLSKLQWASTVDNYRFVIVFSITSATVDIRWI